MATSASAQYRDSISNNERADYLRGVDLQLFNGALRADAVALADSFGQLDRAVISPEVFREHVTMAHAVRDRFYENLSDELYRAYLLPIRIRYEFTSNAGWRKPLSETLEPLLKGGSEVDAAAGKIFGWVGRTVVVTDEAGATYPLGFKGDLDPMTTLHGKRGNETDASILTVAALRSVGIASRVAYAPVIMDGNGGKLWVEYWDGKTWQPWVPSAPAGTADHRAWLRKLFAGRIALVVADPADPVNVTPQYAETATLWEGPSPLTVDKFEANVMLVSDGRLQPAMGRDIYNLEPLGNELGMGKGSYFAIATDRLSSVSWMPVDLQSTGWYQMDFEAGRQVFGSGEEKPDFFAWDPLVEEP